MQAQFQACKAVLNCESLLRKLYYKSMKKSYPNFLGTFVPQSPPEKALFHIIPAPYEKTVSYGKGTAKGPQAILQASQFLEVYDGRCVPSEHGFHTHPPLPCKGSGENDLCEIRRKVSEVFKLGKVPVLLGGEHTVTFGALQAAAEYFGKGGVGVVQFDAHADLRDSFQGSPLSHACVMRRAVADLGLQIFQIGVRSLSPEEVAYRVQMKIKHLDAVLLDGGRPLGNILPESFPRNIYVTIDVDGLDPSIMPATGTPEPGGLGWHQMMGILDGIASEREIAGFDVVELSPIKGLHHPDYTAARLILNFMGIISSADKIRTS